MERRGYLPRVQLRGFVRQDLNIGENEVVEMVIMVERVIVVEVVV